MGRQTGATTGARRTAAPFRSIALSTFIAAAIAGLAAGAIDALWSWQHLDQFTGFFGKLRAALYLSASYALAAASVAPFIAVVSVAAWRATRMNEAFAGLRRRSRAAPLALALTMFPSVYTVLQAFFAIGLPILATRKHIGLVVVVAMALAVAALVLGCVLGAVLARVLEPAIESVARRIRRPGMLVSSSLTLAVFGVTMALTLGALALRARATVALLNVGGYLRPCLIALVIAALAIALRGVATSLANRAFARHRTPLVVAASIGSAIVAMLVLGASAPARKAAVTHSGLGAPITQFVRRLFDLDRDGHSRVLGGGDCDDWSSAINPGAPEIPDDGIDNNCVGGDVTLTRDLADVDFVALPDGLPSDLNVLLITIDTLRADHLGSYGYSRDTSPALDALAADGLVFENAWAHAPSTRYSIPAILTGRLPLSVDYIPIGGGGWPGLSPANTTIAEVFEASGYATGAILNYWYFEERREMNQGYGHYDNTNRVLHKGVKGEGPAQTEGSSSKQQTDKAIAFIEKTKTPFHLWVHYYDPHYAYEKHEGTKEFGGGKVGLYDHEVRFTDDHIGRLIADLKSRGLYDKTAIVVTGDHGEGFGEHGISLHGYHLYAAQTKVPLIIRVPGLPAGRSKMPVSHVDILPTLANLVGAEPTKEMDGRSLVDQLARTTHRQEDRVVFQQLSFENNNEMRAAVSKQCHVIFNVSPHRSWETYRIDRDPKETRDLADGDCAKTREALEAFYDRSGIPDDAATALVEAPTIETQLRDVVFDSKVRFDGIDFPATIKRGQSTAVTLAWTALGSLGADWKVFVHLEGQGPAKKGFIQADHTPARPSSWWRKGQTIQYRRSLQIPSSARPGQYRVYVGLFRGKERLTVTTGAQPAGDKYFAGTIAVTP